ncbi:hypothetical protein PILCRDRAFT_16385 [Piloderma croceum F 1598]|uniref:Uncharacterized protein n=1 Tax=Piloderma croceum (strain F 1598) TaxID=765440 RepID=A0A0C3EWP4_PILCF|nr:hypothetical protein PILCRDRAFT_16385 [Piloderma croceum F 1598]
MAKPKRKPDGRTSQVLQRDSRETHQVPDNPPQLPIRDSIGNEEPTLPDLHCSSHIQATTSDTLGNGDSSEQVRAKFQITSEDCKGNPQSNREEDTGSIRKSSDLTPVEGLDERRTTLLIEEHSVPDTDTLHDGEAELMKELFERRGLWIKKLERDLYLAAECLREVQDKDQARTNSHAQSRQSNQYGLTEEDENIIQAMRKLHSLTRGSYEDIEDSNKAERKRIHQQEDLKVEVEQLRQEQEVYETECKQCGAVVRNREPDRPCEDVRPGGEMRRREHYREWLATQVILDTMCEGDITEHGYSNIPTRDKQAGYPGYPQSENSD